MDCSHLFGNTTLLSRTPRHTWLTTLPERRRHQNARLEKSTICRTIADNDDRIKLSAGSQHLFSMDTSISRIAVKVSAKAERAVKKGHPWVYSNSVENVKGDGKPGDLAILFDRRTNKFMAVGLYDPESPLRVRVLHKGSPLTIDQDFWDSRVQVAMEHRQSVGLGTEGSDQSTTGFRWINGESDGLPGLVVDQYHDTLVAKVYSLALFPHLPDLVSALTSNIRPARVVLRLARNTQAAARKMWGLEDGTLLVGSLPQDTQVVTFKENGLVFEANVIKGQKTGFFLDQRENRMRVEELSKGANVLNAFSFSGGFSLYAARGGARSVTSLDISPHALEEAHRNFALNSHVPSISACQHRTVQADCFKWLAEVGPGSDFDVVILDPPCLAKKQSEKDGALSAYKRLAGLGLKALKPGGVLVAASCSARVTLEEFCDQVLSAVAQSGRSFAEIERRNQPLDHHALIDEAKYLKCIYIQTFVKSGSN